ncbi:fibulin-5 isoform X2 [Echeneis naucrates]|uniref:fibulin-5 isoform X2 n=1 Tax=Echeneis naucrates TaxID=173247 RepID=UPI001114691D|nr:fibulin-5 isoform X2 [Echeneis naucrates]
MLFEIRGFRFCSSARMLAALLFILLCVQPGHGQTCTEGFAYDRRARQCIDVDECRTLPDVCRGDMRCVNQNGGYLCIPRSLYNQPYRPAGPLPPEPAYPDSSVGFSDTFVPADPRSVEPSYPRVRSTAQCLLGYTAAEDGSCNDIDECETNSHHCNPTQVCINTLGGYTCSCTEGYWLIGGQCQDIDECRYGYCQQLCANVPGSYSCSCNPGFILNPDSRTCQDVDECEDEPCSHGCFNTYGSFMCNCDEGFELASDGTTCIDLDECSFSEFLCQHRCVNTPGSFSCICPPGYYVYEDGRSCEAMNVTLVTTPVQQHKYVSISREATHAWILYSVTLLTSKLVTISACVQLRTLPAGTSPSPFCTDTWTCRRGAVCLQTSSRCRPPRATQAPSTSSR